MAEVFLARREGPAGFRKDLVIKRILPHLARNQDFVAMFLREARLAALIDHPNLVHVSAFGEIEGEYYLAMEYVDGFTLTEVARQMPLFSPGVACRITVDVLEALNAVHGARAPEGEVLGLVHRDVGPGNVMLTRDGAVKLLDFGIAVSKGDDTTTRMGTRRFMSPEQLDGRPQDARSDLFSVAVLLYALLSGRAPYEGHPMEVPARPDDIPEALWPSIASALAPDPEARPASARALLAPLELFLASCGAEGTRSHLAAVVQAILPGLEAPTDAKLGRWAPELTHLTRAQGGAEVTVPPPTSRRHLGWAAGGLALLLLGAGGAAWWQGQQGGTAEALPETAAVVERPPGLLPTPEPAPAPVAAPEPIPVPEPAPTRQVTADAHPAPRRPKDLRPGRLTIDTRPWTEVFLGPRRLGMTPLQGVELPAGRHRLRLRNPDVGLDTTVTVQIRPGQETRLRRAL
jgi:hypothetical protein